MSEASAGLLLSRRTRRHAVLFGLQTVPLIVMGVYVIAAVVCAAVFQHLGLILAMLVVGLLLYGAMREPVRMDRAPWVRRLVERVRVGGSARDAFTPTEDTPFPRPVGDIVILGVARDEHSPEQAVIRHSPTGTKRAYFTATVEIEGRGDGLRSLAATQREDQELERALNRLAEARCPVDELSLMARATPGLPVSYKEQVRALGAAGAGGHHAR